jgi:thioredoxin-like negative regulator of GroEL
MLVAERFGVKSIPSILVVRGGREVRGVEAGLC